MGDQQKFERAPKFATRGEIGDDVRMRLADQLDRVHGDGNQREGEDSEDRRGLLPLNRGFGPKNTHRQIDNEYPVEGPKHEMHPPQQCGENGEQRSIAPVRGIQPADQEEETCGGGAGSQRVRTGVGRFVVEALERETGEHGEPARLRMNQPRGQPRDQPEGDSKHD